MCSGHELLPVNGGMPPLVKDTVKDIRNGVVASDGSRAIRAADSVMTVGVAVCRAGCTICAPMGTRSRFQDDIVHPSADADLENGIRHVVAGGGGELKPGSSARPTTRQSPSGVRRSDSRVVAPLGDGVFGGHQGEGSLSGNVVGWKGKVDDALGLEQLFVYALGEPQ